MKHTLQNRYSFVFGNTLEDATIRLHKNFTTNNKNRFYDIVFSTNMTDFKYRVCNNCGHLFEVHKSHYEYTGWCSACKRCWNFPMETKMWYLNEKI